MRRLTCRLFGHHIVRTLGLLPDWGDEMVCLRCFDRSSMPTNEESR